MPSSTAFRFAAFYSLAFTALILALGATMYWAIRRELRYELEQRVMTERAAVLHEAGAPGPGLVRVIVDRTAHEHGDMRYAVLAADGSLVAGRPVTATPVLGWSDMWFSRKGDGPDATRAFASRLPGNGMLVVGSDPEAIEELDERMIPLFTVAFGLIAAIGIGGAFLLSGALGRRLGAIDRTASAIIDGDMTRRMPLKGTGDEFDRLSATLNHMLDRIADLLDNLRQVSSDLAHDLRTPLARIRQRLDLALGGGGGEAALRAAMQHAIEQIDATLDVFAAILSISEVEASGVGPRMRRFDLSALAGDLAETYVLSAEDGGRRLERSIASGIEIDGNRDLVAQLLVNLLDNALNHTPPGTVIGFDLTASEEAACLVVTDNGPGVADEDRERVFKRFTRLERSRTTPGNGLGLSLVAAIAKAHGGTVRLDDNHPGVKAMVTIPRRPR